MTAARPLHGVVRALVGLALSALVVSVSATAHASVFDIFGMTARGTAMGGALGAAAEDHAATFYNPAGLVRRKKTHLGITAQVLAPVLDIATRGGSRSPVLPETKYGVTAGIVFPLGGKIDDRIALGIALFLPFPQFTPYQSIDPATPQYYLYQNGPDAFVLAAGLAGELFDWLQIGVGAQILASFEGQLEIDVAVGDRRVEHRALSGDLLGEIAPVLGLIVEPYEGLRFGFTYRDDLSLDFDLPVRFHIAEIGLLDIDAGGRGLYTPDQLNFAVAWELPWAPLLIAVDATWMLWEQAPSPALRVEATLDDSGLTGGVGDPTVIETYRTVDSELGARDVVVPRLGLEYRVSDLLALQGGYFYRASPIPDQTGYSSYVDNAAHVASVGASLTWNDPLEVHENPVTIDLFVQATGLAERSASKIPSQDVEGVGDWVSSGMVWNAGLEWRHDF